MLEQPCYCTSTKPRRSRTFSESLKPTSASSSKDIFWLVVWNIFHFPFHIWDNMGCHPSHWLSHVPRWLLHHQRVFNAKQKSFIRNAPRDDDEEADDSPSSGAPGGGGTLGGESWPTNCVWIENIGKWRFCGWVNYHADSVPGNFGLARWICL